MLRNALRASQKLETALKNGKLFITLRVSFTLVQITFSTISECEY